MKIIRTTKREGLIRSRIMGAQYATGEVLTFLDSHCECTYGWLEPLLDRIARNQTTVVCPVIDTIDDKTFEYKYFDDDYQNVGGFDWRLMFLWEPLPQREKHRQKHVSDPIRTPVMAGNSIWVYYTECLILINTQI